MPTTVLPYCIYHIVFTILVRINLGLVQQMCYSKDCGNYSVNIDGYGMIFVFYEMHRHQ